MKLIIDMDNVLNNMIYKIVEEYNKTFSTRWTIEDVKDYRYYNSFNVDKEIGHRFTKTLFTMPGFWLSLNPQPDSQRVVMRLLKNYDIYIATKPYIGSRNCFAEKVDWLNKNFPFVGEEKLIFTHDKSLLKGDIIIDDHPDNLNGFNGTTIVFDYAFNRDYEATYRARNWKEIEKLLI